MKRVYYLKNKEIIKIKEHYLLEFILKKKIANKKEKPRKNIKIIFNYF